MKKYILLIIYLFVFVINSYSVLFNFNYSDEEKYQLTIRGDIKTYLNKKYIGLQVREVKAILDISKFDNDKVRIKGNVYHYDKSMRESSSVGFMIDAFEECSFILNENGFISVSSNPVFPPVQNVPFFPEQDLNTGDIYKGLGKASIKLFNMQNAELAEIEITIKYTGKKSLWGNEYDFFEISYNFTRLLNGNSIKKPRGRHNLQLYFDRNTGKPVFMKDKFIEEIQMKNGDVIKRDGFFFYFWKIIVPMNKKKVLDDLTDDVDEDILKDLDFKKKKEGISITINNLKFKPDSVELLDIDKPKLEELYKMLSKIKDRSFLIVGHTALAGTEEERLKLSTERAKMVAEYLIKRGIDPKRIFYAGKGAKEPVAPNDTEENMKKNRRVEIIILED